MSTTARHIALAALALLLAGCSPDQPPEGSPSLSDTTSPLLQLPGQEDTAAADTSAAGPGLDLATILARAAEQGPDGKLAVFNDMNAPERIEREPIVNRHQPGVIDTLRTHVYPGLTLTVYQASGSSREMMQEVRVTGNQYRTADGLGVGSTRAEVEGKFGAPTSMEDVGSMYELYDGPDDPTPTMLTVSYVADRVRWMRWGFYVD